MKTTKEMNIKEKVVMVASSMEIEMTDTNFDYDKAGMNIMFGNDEDLPIIKEKMDNIVKLLKEKKNESEEAFTQFMNLDFEDEIWYMI